jgi:hypothetical protein
MSKLDKLYDRYHHDPVFARYVDMMRMAIVELHLGPGEIRDCAMLASYIEVERRPPEPIPYDPGTGIPSDLGRYQR